MFYFKKIFLILAIAVTAIFHANAALNESTKPIEISVYLEENLPFSGFNSQKQAKGMIVDYWRHWSTVSNIKVNFKPYFRQDLPELLNIQQPAIYSGFNLNGRDKSQLNAFAFMSLTSELYYLPKNSASLKTSLVGKTVPIVVGGLLPEARQLPLFANNGNMIYKEYPGILEMLMDLYLGDIDAFMFFKTPETADSWVEDLLSYTLNSTKFNASSNELYAYTTPEQQNLLAWVKWGSDSKLIDQELGSLISSVTKPVWGMSESMERYLLISLAIFLFIVLIKRTKRKKDQQFKDLLDSSPYPLVICGLDGKAIYYTNDEAKSLFPFKKIKKGYQFDEAENQVLLARFFNKSSHQSSIEDGIIRLIVDKNIFDIEISAKRIHHQKESAWLCYLKNVTELLKTQRSLNEERELLRKVLDSIPEQIHFKSTKGNIIGCNEVWAKANSTTVDKATGIKETDIQDKEQIQRAHQQESSVWAGEKFNAQEWIQQKNQQLSLMNITKVPLYNDKGNVFSILSVASDMTDIHNLNKQLKDENAQRQKTERALSKQHTLLRSIFDTAKDPIGLLDQHGCILGANRPFSFFMGTDIEDIEGAYQKDLLPYERSDWSERQNKEVIQLNESIIFEEFVFFEGEETWYEVHKTPFIDEDSDLRGIVVMARDITERKNKELKLTHEASEFEQQSLSDPLTKIANRRAFDEAIDSYWKIASENKAPLSLVMCDIDFFKPYNDTYGHQKGDDALQQVAAILQRKCEEHGCFVARYGGEEFVILILDKSATQALHVTEDMRKAIESEHIEHQKSSVSSFITLSMGLATHLPTSNGANSRALIKEADTALYEAKSTGRNQVQVA